MGTIAVVDDESFGAEVRAATGPVLVEFGTAWCGPCKAMVPVLEALAREYAGRLKVVTLDADASPRTATDLQVRGFPTIVVMKDGREVARQLGAVSRTRLAALVADHL